MHISLYVNILAISISFIRLMYKECLNFARIATVSHRCLARNSKIHRNTNRQPARRCEPALPDVTPYSRTRLAATEPSALSQ